MKDWKNDFWESDLDHGYEMFIEKRVHGCLFTQEKIIAKVTEENKKEYDILIQLTDDNQFYGLSCSCSHEDTGHCPHVVATLFKYEQEKEQRKANELVKLISYANEQDIQDFLLIILKENQELAQRFQEHTAIKNMDDYDKMIAILEKHTHYSGNNIHDRTLQNINKELSEFLNSLIDTSIAKKQILHAFELMNRIVEHFDLAKVHNVENNISLIMHQWYSLWKNYLDMRLSKKNNEYILNFRLK